MISVTFFRDDKPEQEPVTLGTIAHDHTTGHTVISGPDEAAVHRIAASFTIRGFDGTDVIAATLADHPVYWLRNVPARFSNGYQYATLDSDDTDARPELLRPNELPGRRA